MRNPKKEQDFVALNRPIEPFSGSFLWLLYLWMTIILVGGVLSLGFYFPLRLLGFVWKPAKNAAEQVVVSGISFLLKIQPWLKLKANLNIPKAPALLVSNHRSTLDVFILLARIKGIRVVAKQILFFIPYLGLMMRALRDIPIKRGQLDSYWKALREVQLGVKNGDRIHIFPEMTRCRPGFKGVQDFQQAPFWIAYQEKLPIVLIAFLNTDRAWPKGNWRLSFREPIEAKFVSTLDPITFQSAADLQRAAYDRINETVLESI